MVKNNNSNMEDVKKFMNFMNEEYDKNYLGLSTEGEYNPVKVEKFIKSMDDIIQEMEDLFDGGAGDELEEPDDANVSEQMDDLASRMKISNDDFREIIKRAKNTKHLKHYIHLLEWYLTQPDPREEDKKYMLKNEIGNLMRNKNLSSEQLLSVKKFINDL